MGEVGLHNVDEDWPGQEVVDDIQKTYCQEQGCHDQPSGWQQSPVRKPPRCFHFGLIQAKFQIAEHPVGHEWICKCGRVYQVMWQDSVDGAKILMPVDA